MSTVQLENTHYLLGCIGKKTLQKYPFLLSSSWLSSDFFMPPPWNHITLTKIKNEQEQVSGSKLCESQFFQLLTPSSPLVGKASMNHQDGGEMFPSSRSLQVANVLALNARGTHASK